MIKHCFIVTSAVNSKFGVYSPAARLTQTIATLQNIREKVPNCKIIVMECAGTPLTLPQSNLLEEYSDLLLDFTQDPDVIALYQSDNWDVVKNSTEIMCFGRTLRMCQDDGDFSGYDRIHKMSGRYLLNSEFDLQLYEKEHDRIVIGPKNNSQFPFEVTGIELQYMARLWSWTNELTERIIKVYEDSLAYIGERVSRGGYADIEHVLYKFLPPEFITEVPMLGVEGSIAPNGVAIRN
ncbi:hypothetical protein UFOVP257_77 [uncultured Caudovirales phage]|uniref:Uncharacterized protein n=1 Tax=uncultured Caudovirales phage TaxID=2100421 RepID=A0A6J5LNA9_9CAUD|nr:hypothetical protein UFOVP257_77 [uncultured Caudovirales phage]